MGNLNLRFVIFDLKAAAHKSKIKDLKFLILPILSILV